jgi:hypothetical protein
MTQPVHARRLALPGLLLRLLPLLLAAALYTNAVRLPFFSDDIPTQRYLTQATFADIWTKVDMNGTYYRPFANVFYKYLPLEPALWHMVMVWVYVALVALVGRFAHALRLRPVETALAMLAFAALPFHAQAVLWVGAGFHLLLTLLALLALIGFLRALKGHRMWGALAACAGFLAPFAHESGVVVPLLLALAGAASGGLRWHRRWVWLLVWLPAVGGAALYWFVRAQLVAGGGLQPQWEHLPRSAGFFAQGLALPAAFVAGLLPGDPALRAWAAVVTALVAGLAWHWRRGDRSGIRLIMLCAAWAALALAPAYLLLHPDYVRYGERLIMVGAPAMAVLGVLVARHAPAAWRWAWLGLLVGGGVLFGREYVALYHLHGDHYRQLFALVAPHPAESRMLFINLPSQIESERYPLPLTHANAGLLTDWLELRDFLWLNMAFREFTHVSYAHVPSLAAPVPGHIIQLYGDWVEAPQMPALIARQDVVFYTRYEAGRYVPQRLAQRLPITTGELARFGEAAALLTLETGWRDGDVVLRLGWQRVGNGPVPYTVFAQVLCAGTIVGQADGDPLRNLYPFAHWQPLEAWAEERLVMLETPCAAPELRLGLYDRATGQRAPATAQGQRLVDDALALPLNAAG